MYKFTCVFRNIILSLALFAGSQSIGQNINYYAFIPDKAGDIDREGFDIGYYAIYSQWDLNDDGEISEPEFYKVVFKRLDTNNDNYLSQNEWRLCEKYLFTSGGDNEKKESNNIIQKKKQKVKNLKFQNLDADNDKKLGLNEVEAGLREIEYFQTFDSNDNNTLNRNELNSQVYEYMDLDNNGIIEKREFERIQSLYID